MAKTSLHTHTAVARLPGVSYIGFLVHVAHKRAIVWQMF